MNPLLQNIPGEVAGLSIYEAPLPRPKIQIRPDLKWITDEARDDINIWLRARFGYRAVLDKNTCLISPTYGMIVVPHGMAGILANIGV